RKLQEGPEDFVREVSEMERPVKVHQALVPGERLEQWDAFLDRQEGDKEKAVNQEDVNGVGNPLGSQNVAEELPLERQRGAAWVSRKPQSRELEREPDADQQ